MAVVRIKSPPKIKIFFRERKARTKPRIKIKAPSEQTLKPSKVPRIIASTGREY